MDSGTLSDWKKRFGLMLKIFKSTCQNPFDGLQNWIKVLLTYDVTELQHNKVTLLFSVKD